MRAPLQLLSLCLCTLVWTAATTASASPQVFIGEITAQEMQAHVDFLASDLLEGRNAGTRGAEIAAEYIASEFHQLGLSMLGDSWLMEFELSRASGSLTASIGIGIARHEGPSLMEVPSNSSAGEVEGLLASEDTDSLEGKIALAADVTRLRDRREKVEELAAKGAIAIVLLAEDEWIEQRSRRRTGMQELPSSEDRVASARVQAIASFGDPGPGIGLGALVGGQVVLGAFAGGTFTPAQDLPTPSLPVVRVCRTLGAALQAAASAGEQVTISVSRSGKQTTTNVLGLLRGSNPELADEYVVIGAHYDHVGVSSRGSVYNGADDNASGTAGVLEVAEAFATAEVPPRRSVIFAAWGAEEKGLVGSRAFLRAAKVPPEKIVAYINLDMIGRNKPRELSVICASDTLKGWVEETAERYGFEADPGSGFLLNMSDSGPFVAKEVPTAFFNSGMHGDLHQPGDDADKIDPDKAARAARMALEFTHRAANGEETPVFTAPDSGRGGGGIRVQGSSSGSGRRLGVIPGRSEGKGVEVRGVSSGTLAKKIGIQAGDRILRIGSKTLEKRTDLSPALKEVKAGEEFDIEVLRAKDDGTTETLVLKASFEK